MKRQSEWPIIACFAVGGLLGALVILASSNDLGLDVLFIAKALPGGCCRF
jgi:hypothetical protein